MKYSNKSLDGTQQFSYGDWKCSLPCCCYHEPLLPTRFSFEYRLGAISLSSLCCAHLDIQFCVICKSNFGSMLLTISPSPYLKNYCLSFSIMIDKSGSGIQFVILLLRKFMKKMRLLLWALSSRIWDLYLTATDYSSTPMAVDGKLRADEIT